MNINIYIYYYMYTYITYILHVIYICYIYISIYFAVEQSHPQLVLEESKGTWNRWCRK